MPEAKHGEAAQADVGGVAPELRSHVVTRLIRDAILSGKLRPGDRIAQEALARELGTSRIPVREALGELESEGLVVLVPHSGARVAHVNLVELEEVYLIREAVEPMLLAESAAHLTDEQLTRLRVIAEEIEGSVGRPENWLQLDRSFHLSSYAGAELPRARSIVQDFWNRTQHYRRTLILALDAGSFDVVHLEHRQILDALEHRNGEDAASALLTHIRRTRQTLLQRSHLFDHR
jgi:DNA-binding GntR family transcriptional regulator